MAVPSPPVCGMCGAALVPGAHQCVRCGAATSPPVAWPTQPVPGYLILPREPPAPEPTPRSPLSSGRVGAAVAAFVAVAVVAVAVWVGNTDSTEDAGAPTTGATATTRPISTSTSTATTTVAAPVPPFVEAWRYDSRDDQASGLAYDGVRLYGATNAGRVYAIDPTSGTELWTTDVALRLGVAPVVGGAAVLVTGSEGDNGAVVALDALTGLERWRASLRSEAFFGRPALTRDGAFVSDTDLVAFDLETGQERWRLYDGAAASEPFPASQPVSDGLSLFVAVDVWDGGTRYHKEIRSIDPVTGIELWATFAGRGFPAPALLGGQLVFQVADVGGASAQVVSVDPITGVERWRTAPIEVFGGPVATSDAIVVQTNTQLVAIDYRRGQQRWVRPTLAYTGPAASADRVFVADSTITALDAATGDVVARSNLDSFVQHGPSVAGDLFLVQDDVGRIIAFEVP